MSGADWIAAAFLAACDDELAALKPGNVHVHAPGHGMTVADFRRSATAAAPPLCRAGASLGARVLGAVAATRAAVGQNTNLGIVLLCAPLAMAAERAAAASPEALREALRAVLDRTDLADADAVFRAIVLAAPGGLGAAARHDVREPATVALRVAMAEAAAYDSIARQYTSDFADIFGIGMDSFAAALARWQAPRRAATATYLRFLAVAADSHVQRRHGAAAAARLQREAETMLARLHDASADPQALRADLLAWDAALKQAGVNPGTSADLTVATIFARRLLQGLQSRHRDG